MTEADVVNLRRAGLTDREIHDTCQIVGYFNYVNRLTTGLGIDTRQS